MFKKNLLPFLLPLALLIPGCSDNPTGSAEKEAVLTTRPTPRAFLPLPVSETDTVTIAFRLVEWNSDTKESLWVSETEITEAQYNEVLKSSASSEKLPKVASWFEAANFSNELTKRITADLSLGLTAVYSPASPETVLVTPERIKISPYVAVVNNFDSAAFDPGDTAITWEVISAEFEHYRFRLCTLAILPGDSGATLFAAIQTVFSANPDSVWINGTLLNGPDSGAAIAKIQTLAAAGDTAHLAAYSSGTFFRNSENLSLLPIPDTVSFDTGAAVKTLFVLDTAMHTVGRTLFLHPVKTDLPADTLDIVVLNQVVPSSVFDDYTIFFRYSDTLISHPDTFSVRVWKSDFSANGFRLPTEAEWEGIAGVGPGIDYSTYTGRLASNSAVYGRMAPEPPGSLLPGPRGLYDLTGNLFEWTSDWWAPSSYAPPAAPTVFPSRTLKGGSFLSAGSDQALKIEGRFSENPDSTLGGQTGFRVVMDRADADFLSDLIQ